MKDVHTEHCCLKHGCEYCDETCTVTTKKAPQSYPCEICNPYPDLPCRVVLELIRKIISFPRAEICKHSAACDLLNALEVEGMQVTEELAGAIVDADDDTALALLYKEIESCKKKLFDEYDSSSYGGV